VSIAGGRFLADRASCRLERGARQVSCVPGDSSSVEPRPPAPAGCATCARRVDHRDGSGATALWLAASGGSREDVEVLLAAGADHHATNSEGVSAHDAASRSGHAGCAALLGGA